MIEIIENSLQLAVLGFCSVIAVIRTISTMKRAWLLLAFFYIIFFMGDLYWLFFLIFYGRTPAYSFIPYLSWDASYLFLALLLQHQQVTDFRKKNLLVLAASICFTGSMCLYYMTYGSYLNNIITAVLMSILIWLSASGLLPAKEEDAERNDSGWQRKKVLCKGILFFCLIEYAMWTVTCVLDEPYLYIYYVLDVVLMIAAAMLIPAVRRSSQA